MKKIIDITKKNLNIFEFVGTDKEINCTETVLIGKEIMPHNCDIVFHTDNFLVRNTEYVTLPNMPPYWHICSFTDGDNIMQVIFDDVSKHRYFKNFPFIQGFFKLEMKHFIEDDHITEKYILYPKIKMKGKYIPIAKHMQDFIFKDDLYEYFGVKQYRTFDEIEFTIHDLNNKLFISLIPFENTRENIKKLRGIKYL